MATQGGIGELNERSLHRALKDRYAVAGAATEQPVNGFVADVVVGDRIVEIQTGAFFPLKRKLPRLLEQYPVTLVRPIARDRYIVKIPDDPEHRTTRRKSPAHGNVFHIFSVLTSIAELVDHPNLTLEVPMTTEDHIRVWDDRARRRRGGWVTVDRRLIDVVDTHRIASMGDLFALVADDLDEPFTTLDLAGAMGSNRRLGQQAAYCFRVGGVTEICGKQGNALVYRRPA